MFGGSKLCCSPKLCGRRYCQVGKILILSFFPCNLNGCERDFTPTQTIYYHASVHTCISTCLLHTHTSYVNPGVLGIHLLRSFAPMARPNQLV
ncbi:uncharacterized protein EI90DRAFT_3063923 [Cantharellus anzutake]|uniref:uncharacterized protein n=1 Tax=Cantharellus anzutake TaxID=1750568 RepID=UPI001908A3C3|nr:uncharacterized protein EI90DRAFT_3063923 [Cantharellus anzutake]KAF8328895.1 hypothetical protein EI90DRAFT_3063923 [Cantharellus anzutake]